MLRPAALSKLSRLQPSRSNATSIARTVPAGSEGAPPAVARFVNALACDVIGISPAGSYDCAMTRARSLLLIGGGFFAYFCFGPAGFPLAAWIAPVLLLRFARTTPGRIGIVSIASVLYGACALANRGVIPIPGAVYFVIVAAEAFASTLPYLADRYSRLLPAFASTLLFPLAWVTAEILMTHIPTRGSWNSIAYTQYGNLPLMQLASVTGLTGITFLIAWWAAVVNWAWEREFSWKAMRSGALVYGTVIGTVLIAGQSRLTWPQSQAKSIRAAVVSPPNTFFKPGEITRIERGDVRDQDRIPIRANMLGLNEWLLESARTEARAGAKLIAWPEVGALIFPEDEQLLIRRARDLAREQHIYLLIGLGVIHLGARTPLENKAVFVGPSGNIEFAYRKNRPAPNWESDVMQRGDGGLRVADTAIGRVAAAICFETGFPFYIRQAGRDAADILIVPVNDWAQIKQIHFRMAVFRAIENGVAMLRAAKSGISGAIDPYGRLSAYTDHFTPGARVMVAEIQPLGVRTLYARLGDWFAWFCVASLLSLVIWQLLLRARLTQPRKVGVDTRIDDSHVAVK
jgi:apolipoprotein N-acyltransferase